MYGAVPPLLTLTGVALHDAFCVHCTAEAVSVIGGLMSNVNPRAILDPALSAMVTVYEVRDDAADGVPVIAPVCDAKLRPLGKPGVIVYKRVPEPPLP